VDEQRAQVVDEEVPVLEERQDAEVGGHAQQEIEPPAPRIGRRVDRQPGSEVDHRRQHDQRQESVVPTGIEDVARGQQQIDPPAPREAPVDRQDDDEEEPELVGVEEHEARFSAARGRSRSAAAIRTPTAIRRVGMSGAASAFD
jgi:hypothetical protein